MKTHIFPTALIAVLAAWFTACPSPLHAASSEWHTGQVIGISEMRTDPSTFIIEAATGSRVSHVGVIELVDGEVRVDESNPPGVGQTSLTEFLSRASLDADGEPQYALVEPAAPLTPAQEQGLIAAMKKMRDAHVPYNYSQVLSPNAVNCSQFVWKSFGEAGIDGIGEVEKIRDLNIGAFGGIAAKIWGKVPPLDADSVSPISVVDSPKLKLVKTTLPIDRVVSDREIYLEWRDGGGLNLLAGKLHKSEAEIEKLLEPVAEPTPYRPFPLQWRH